MSEFKHTPGPWLMDTTDSAAIVYTLRETMWNRLPTFENAWQAQFSQDGRHKTPIEEVFANARLAAAAPELLEAVRLFLAYDRSTDTDGLAMMIAYADACSAALAAYTKATGATP